MESTYLTNQMAGSCTRWNADRALIDDSNTFVLTFAIFSISTLASAQIFVPIEVFAPAYTPVSIFPPVLDAIKRYIDKNL